MTRETKLLHLRKPSVTQISLAFGSSLLNANRYHLRINYTFDLGKNGQCRAFFSRPTPI